MDKTEILNAARAEAARMQAVADDAVQMVEAARLASCHPVVLAVLGLRYARTHKKATLLVYGHCR